MLRYYRVFNVEQCELPQAVLDKLPKIETHQHDPIEAAERIIAEMPNLPEIQYGGSQAFYNPITDRITLPPRELFTSTEEIYACLFHELGHSSGSPRYDDQVRHAGFVFERDEEKAFGRGGALANDHDFR
jgi:antirestriction protein ArdC